MPAELRARWVMRVFLAVHPTAQLTARLTTCLDPLRSRIPVKWTRPDGWHFTLQFLGDWPESRLTDLKRALADRSRAMPFTLQPVGLGVFPDWHRPRVLFLQMADDGHLANLVGDVRAAVAACWPEGPQDTRLFQAHLTLAKIKSPLSRNDLNALQNIEVGELPDVLVEGFALVASQLSAQGATYTRLGYFALGQG